LVYDLELKNPTHDKALPLACFERMPSNSYSTSNQGGLVHEMLCLLWDQFWKWVACFICLSTGTEYLGAIWLMETNPASHESRGISHQAHLFAAEIYERRSQMHVCNISLVHLEKTQWKNMGIQESSTSTSFLHAMQFYHEWRNVRNFQLQPYSTNTAPDYCTHWQKPEHGFFKLNVDATIFSNQANHGARMVLHDEQRRFLRKKNISL